MTDKELLELLELAAKAAGYDVKPHPNYKYNVELMWLLAGKLWDPLTDDGDALRLAVKLGMEVCTNGRSESPVGNSTWVCARTDDNGHMLWEVEEHEDDPCAATRRAIVRAAAEIGKAMP